MEVFKLKMITSATLLISFAGVAAYLIIRKKRKVCNAREALNYLTIETVFNEELCNEVVHELRRRCETYKTIGFDCEWVTNNGKRSPVALVQLSTYDGYCGLFRLCHLKTVPYSLKELLEDKTIYKVGVAPGDDAKYLYQDYSVKLWSTLDVRHIVALAGLDSGGLASLSQSLLGITLDKSWRIRCSDWEAETMSERQVHYASADAHVAIRIFVQVVNKLVKQNAWAFFSRRNNDIWSNLDKLCSQFCDTQFKARKCNNDSTKRKKKDDGKRKEKRNTASARSKPLYTNSFLEAPDGELLCICDFKKATWYVEKELADVVKESPFTVRLRFEPAARSVGEVGQYYQTAKENRCVVCGSNHTCGVKKNVVPREYRRYFPDVMKDHSCHDVLLLCLACHQRSNISDLSVRLRLAAECAAPLIHKDFSKLHEDHALRKVKSAARALLHQDKIPMERRKVLEAVVLANYPQHQEVTTELLQEAAELQAYVENTDYSAHGQRVVEWFARRGGLLRLEKLWRKHFLATMRPKHLPPLWSVTHNEERLRVRLLDGRLTDDDLESIGLLEWIEERKSMKLNLNNAR